MTANNRELTAAFLDSLGITIIGFCAIPDNMETMEIERPFPRAIVIGIPLSRSVLETIKDRPTLLYKHHYKTVNWMLDQAAFRLAQRIESLGASALAVPASQTVDWGKNRGHISHKSLCVACGLGHIGRSGLVVHPRFGSQVRYASVLTDLDFPTDGPSTGKCGECRKCISACPAQAISDDGVDLARCLNMLKEFSKIRGIGQYICGLCVKACDGGH